jgi:hypothetical protein
MVEPSQPEENEVKPQDGDNDQVDKLIGDLSCQCPCKAMGCPSYRGFILIAVTSAYVLLVALASGLRDNLHVLQDPIYLMEMGLAFVLGSTALMASSYLMSPDCYGKKWFLLIPYGLFLALIAVCFGRCLGMEHGLHQFEWPLVKQCWFKFWAFGVIPIAVVIFLARKGASIYPIQMAFMQALGVGALGWIGQRLTCPVDDPQHVYIAQWLPVLIVGGALGWLGRKIYRW